MFVAMMENLACFGFEPSENTNAYACNSTSVCTYYVYHYCIARYASLQAEISL